MDVAYKKMGQYSQSPLGRTCLLVLGMHRSGTSALTRLFNIAGAKLPSTQLGAGEGNPTGHWESAALMQYHESVLKELGSTWRDWRLLEVGRLSVARRRDIRAEIGDLLALEFDDAPLFVLKDPRICRFASLYLEALEDASITSRVVFVFRNPLEVCESLERRDGLSRSDAAMLWLRHVLDSELATRSCDRVIISYEAVLNDWRTELARISNALQISWPYSLDDISAPVSEFLDAKLRHHFHTTEDVLLDPTLRDWVGETYSALRILEKNPEAAAPLAILDAVFREFNHATPLMHRLQTELRSQFEQDRALSDASISELEERAARSAIEVTTLVAEIEQERQKAAALDVSLSEAEERATKNADEVTMLEAEIEQERQKAAALSASLSEAKERTAKSADDAAAMAAKLECEKQNAAAVALERDEKVRRLELERVEFESRAVMTNELLLEWKEELAARDSEFQVVKSEKDKIARSLSWRPTRPIQSGADELPSLPRQISRSSRLLERLLTFQYVVELRRRRRLRKESRMITLSGLFDPSWYLGQYEDARVAGVNAAHHFLNHGWREGRDPSPFFDTKWYLEQSPDVVAADVNPLLHYIRHGAAEGRLPKVPHKAKRARSDDSNHAVSGGNGLESGGLRSGAIQTVTKFARKAVTKVFHGGPSPLKLQTDHIKRFIDFEPQPPAPPREPLDPFCLKITFVIPDFIPGAGGHMTIFRIAHFLEKFGHQVSFLVQNPTHHKSGDEVKQTTLAHFVPIEGRFYRLGERLPDLSGDALVATDRYTCFPVQAMTGFRKKFYFVQDYETMFYPMGTEALLTEHTYTMGLDCLCAGDWLAEKIAETYGSWTCSWPLAYDPSYYYSKSDVVRDPNRIAFYARFVTPRRAVELGLMALEILERRGLDFHVDFFGWDVGNLEAGYSYTDHGVLPAQELGDLYRKAAIGVVFSATNHSLTNKEMMACGLPVVDLDVESVRSIFPPESLQFVKPVPEAIADGIEELLTDRNRRVRLAECGRALVKDVSWENSARIVEGAIKERVELESHQSSADEK